jgi:hypothetical protein
MASLVIGSLGSAVGGAVGGPVGAAIGYGLGTMIGNQIDQALWLPESTHQTVGPRLQDVCIQTSTYGRMIPVVLGKCRIAGNILWALPIKETANHITREMEGGKGGSTTTHRHTHFSYSATLAIGLCAGPITDVTRLWADAKELCLGRDIRFRLYPGTEEQRPDSLLQSYLGHHQTPAYRGLAYVVIEDFPLADYGNRIPNFTFEVQRQLRGAAAEPTVEERIKSMVMIPGSGECVYDPTIQHKMTTKKLFGRTHIYGPTTALNCHNQLEQPNAVLAIDQLQRTCPHVEWVSLVVTWFGTSLDIHTCIVKPGVEYQEGGEIQHEPWQVGPYQRHNAHLIQRDQTDRPQYGGTPTDASLLRYIATLQARGYKVLVTPMLCMDIAGKPWRGHLTGAAEHVMHFYQKPDGYRAFIRHYAQLFQGKVDGLLIGSELVGLTSIHDAMHHYPFVEALQKLAQELRQQMGPDVMLSYGADWSEYHHTEGGWYHLDPLWAMPEISVVGIDAYFPLTDSKKQTYDVKQVMEGWQAGEGYDFYYIDSERTQKSPLAPPYAWKNIAWWWGHPHTNPDGKVTAWQPGMKKIWFMEYGFPSVDGATNQPNIFVDPNCRDGGYPRHSKRQMDIYAQRSGIEATECFWENSDMVERRFLWCWDARPYPYWPQLQEVWVDGSLWSLGHWVNGKLGVCTVAAILAYLCRHAGLSHHEYDVSTITGVFDGVILTQRFTWRSVIEALQCAFAFDTIEHQGKLIFRPRGQKSPQRITSEALVVTTPSQPPLACVRRHQHELPASVAIDYVDAMLDYHMNMALAIHPTFSCGQQQRFTLPLVLHSEAAMAMAKRLLYSAHVEQMQYQFYLPPSALALMPGDILEIGEPPLRVRITEMTLEANYVLSLKAVADDLACYPSHSTSAPHARTIPTPQAPVTIDLWAKELSLCFDTMPTGPVLSLAALPTGTSWKPVQVFAIENGRAQNIAELRHPATFGTVIISPGPGSIYLADHASYIEVLLQHGSLESIEESEALSRHHLALIGQEVIGFRTAKLLAPHHYRLQGLCRGISGTEMACPMHTPGEMFLLLDHAVQPLVLPSAMRGKELCLLPVIYGDTLILSAPDKQSTLTITGHAIAPMAPIHIRGWRDGNGTLHLRWQRRSRLLSPWRDYGDMPQDSTPECYEVILQQGQQIVRQLVKESYFTYTSAILDMDTPIEVSVTEISGLTGPGTPGFARL